MCSHWTMVYIPTTPQVYLVYARRCGVIQVELQGPVYTVLLSPVAPVSAAVVLKAEKRVLMDVNLTRELEKNKQPQK